MGARLNRLCRHCLWTALAVSTLETCAAWAQLPEFPNAIRPLLAQEEGNISPGEEPFPFLKDPALIPWYQGVGTGVAVLLTFFIAWYLIYPSLLRRGGVWPVTLFGRCTSAAWVSSWAIGLIVYWDDLVIPPGAPFLREWGLRLACLGIAALFGTLSLAYWRSESSTRAS